MTSTIFGSCRNISGNQGDTEMEISHIRLEKKWAGMHAEACHSISNNFIGYDQNM